MSTLTNSLRRRLFATGAIVLFTAANVSVYREVFRPRELSVAVLNAGKGVAVFARSPSGKTLLIDTGPDAGTLRFLAHGRAPWDRVIDVVVLTDGASGAAGALPAVLERYRVGTLILPGSGRLVSPALLKAVREYRGDEKPFYARRGMRIFLGGGAVADLLWPTEDAAHASVKNARASLRLSYGTTSIVVDKGLSKGAATWRAVLDSGVAAPDAVISSSTPTLTYVSDGRVVQSQK